MLPMRRFAERSKQPLENMTNSDSGQETQTKVVWPRLKVFRLSKDDPAGHSKMKEKKRQTEKEVGRQYLEVDRDGLCQLNLGSLKQDKVERDCCAVICGAPKTFQGYGIEKNRIKNCT